MDLAKRAPRQAGEKKVVVSRYYVKDRARGRHICCSSFSPIIFLRTISRFGRFQLTGAAIKDGRRGGRPGAGPKSRVPRMYFRLQFVWTVDPAYDDRSRHSAFAAPHWAGQQTHTDDEGRFTYGPVHSTQDVQCAAQNAYGPGAYCVAVIGAPLLLL
ncbi:hypothetical protein XA68_15385 [Ophiocordyceps unilateralis]|uniref:Uncharacterized protein n=1 Tax=Ophiocordyceps unilateralis TaxID=268505 RepID=A0A2A9P6S0_OPHUN|nr:hypothetical protein XA68_15385 [Ophiocordyceps unilateralis]